MLWKGDAQRAEDWWSSGIWNFTASIPFL